MNNSETIAAIATAMSDSGIGIVRVSGDEALEIVNKIYRSRETDKDGNSIPLKSLFDYKSHTIHYGFIYDGDELIDEVMVAIMKAPNSFTREDTVEIDCHGGIFVTNRILETVIKNGARIAEPGEYTKSAFLNGRIDLSKAEAIIDLIHAKSEFALKNSVKQLKGSISNAVKRLRKAILFEIAFIESALDDPENISLEGYGQELLTKIDHMLGKVKNLLSTSDNGKILKEGINTVIIGKPNAGKSSLLNHLVGEEKAIVTSVAGTTRDALEETINLNGITLNVIDTAGIRSTHDIVEKIGVDRAKKYAKNADLIIYVVDSSIDLDESDEEIIRLIKDKKTIILLNKADLDMIVDEDSVHKKIIDLYKQQMDDNTIDDPDDHLTIIRGSVKENTGMTEFEDAIKNMFFHGELSFNDEVYITNMRHKEALMNAKYSLEMVRKSLLDEMPEDFYSIDLMNAYASLGTIIGEEVGEDLINEIFTKFCMGK